MITKLEVGLYNETRGHVIIEHVGDFYTGKFIQAAFYDHEMNFLTGYNIKEGKESTPENFMNYMGGAAHAYDFDIIKSLEHEHIIREYVAGKA